MKDDSSVIGCRFSGDGYNANYLAEMPVTNDPGKHIWIARGIFMPLGVKEET